MTESMYASKTSLTPKSNMIRPLSRKDIFYSGSVTNLREFQSQKSLTNYRNSVVSLTKYERAHSGDMRDNDLEKGKEQPREYTQCIFFYFIILILDLFQNTTYAHVLNCQILSKVLYQR